MEKQELENPKSAETLNTIVESVLKERLTPFIKITEPGCWEFKSGSKLSGIRRLIYQLFKGDFNKKLNLLHSCDNPPCVNPSHLRPGTQKENMEDMVKKGRNKMNIAHKHIGIEIIKEIRTAYDSASGGRYGRDRLAKKFKIQPYYVTLIAQRKARN